MPDDPPPVTPPAGDPARSIEDRLSALEAVVAAERSEVRTRRLAVTDDDGHERIVAGVVDGQADLHLALDGEQHSVLILSAGTDKDLGPMIGVQLCAEGNEVASLSAWRDGPAPWRAALTGAVVHPAADAPE